MTTRKDTFGVFVYTKKNDRNVSYEYFSENKKAVTAAKKTFSDLPNKKDCYVEVWEQDERGMWGSVGEPIWKSDK